MTETIAAIAEAMRTSLRPSLAATFHVVRDHNDTRTAPVHIKNNRVARYLAHRGGMTPEGCTEADFERARSNHRLPIPDIREILKALWSFRLLGWLPHDTSYMHYGQIRDIVKAGTTRPADTSNMIPDWFADRLSVDEQIAFATGTKDN